MILIVLTGIAFADQPVPAVPETQGLVTTTGADVVGLATETDAAAWTLTNDGAGGTVAFTYQGGPSPLSLDPASLAQLVSLGGSYTLGSGVIATITIPPSILNTPTAGNPAQTWGDIVVFMDGLSAYSKKTISGGIHTGSIDPGQVQYTTAYDASILGQAGHTVLTKGMTINTGNKVAATQTNLKASTLLTYVATVDGGNVVGSENLLLDGAGNTTKASDRMLCPFASSPVDVIPAYCNIVQTGNTYDLTVGTVSSSMNERFVGTDATIPVQLDQTFSVMPYGTNEGSIPAIGSTSAYIKTHIQESRGYNDVTLYYLSFVVPVPSTPLKAEDLQYSESSSASGTIQQFTKVIHYQSGKSLMP